MLYSIVLYCIVLYGPGFLFSFVALQTVLLFIFCSLQFHLTPPPPPATKIKKNKNKKQKTLALIYALLQGK